MSKGFQDGKLIFLPIQVLLRVVRKEIPVRKNQTPSIFSAIKIPVGLIWLSVLAWSPSSLSHAQIGLL